MQAEAIPRLKVIASKNTKYLIDQLPQNEMLPKSIKSPGFVASKYMLPNPLARRFFLFLYFNSFLTYREIYIAKNSF